MGSESHRATKKTDVSTCLGLRILAAIRKYGLEMGASENRGPEYSTPNSRILIIRTPKQGTPNLRKLPNVKLVLQAHEQAAFNLISLCSGVQVVLKPLYSSALTIPRCKTVNRRTPQPETWFHESSVQHYLKF